MIFLKSRWLKKTVKTLLVMAAGMLLANIIIFVIYLNGREDLEVWHLADLDEEFTVDSEVADFEAYLKLEDRLFAQLDELVYAKVEPGDDTSINRYSRGSLSDPQRWSPNWNRSVEFTASRDAPSILLIHGMSDSPYSLHNMAERLHEEGAHVLVLRVPGHGTAPSGLLDVTWQDMAAAVRLAVAHLAKNNPGQPIHIVGYSNGAALGVHYALSTLDDPQLPRVAGLVLISPEIGLTRIAALARWQARLGRVLGLEKLAWNTLLPEYDPFKYGSFAVNAGDVSYRITHEIQRRITELTRSGSMDEMPPILAFSSVVDATVLAPALVANLLNRVPANGNQLVLFDINHMAGLGPLLNWSPDAMVKALKEDPHPTYTLSLVTNRGDSGSGGGVEVHHWEPGKKEKTVDNLDTLWPEHVYSLTHIALPFPPQDPLYGGLPVQASPGIQLGNIAMYGERGVLKISAADQLRLRWNPFYAYLEDRALEFMQLNSGR